MEGKFTQYQTIGQLPDTFITNNPMNVESCTASEAYDDFTKAVSELPLYESTPENCPFL